MPVIHLPLARQDIVGIASDRDVGIQGGIDDLAQRYPPGEKLQKAVGVIDVRGDSYSIVISNESRVSRADRVLGVATTPSRLSRGGWVKVR